MIDTCYLGDVRDGLKAFVAAGLRAQCIVSSSPYWALRSYLPADHPDKAKEIGQERYLDCLAWARGELPCSSCYICTLRWVFSLAHEVLADDGVMWLNHGDSYTANAKGHNGFGSSGLTNDGNYQAEANPNGMNRVRQPGLKSKDICAQPWRLALALQSDGWYWRDEIIWHKRNAMPSSQRDRCTRAHEVVLMFSKSERYFYDADAIKEEASPDTHARLAKWKTPDGGWDTSVGEGGHGSVHRNGREDGQIRKPVAGWANGTCDHSAAAHAQPKNDGDPRKMRRDTSHRKMERAPAVPGATIHTGLAGHSGPHVPRAKNNESFDAAMAVMPAMRMKRSVWDVPSRGYKDAHFATFPPDLIAPMILAGSRVGDVVLDPFLGSGTVAEVAQSLGRHWIGCDLHSGYAPMQKQRAAQRGLPLQAIPDVSAGQRPRQP